MKWGSSVSMTTGLQVRLRFIFFFKTLEPSGVHSTYSVGARDTFPGGKLGGVWNWPLMICLSSSRANVRMCEDIPPLPPIALMSWTGTAYYIIHCYMLVLPKVYLNHFWCWCPKVPLFVCAPLCVGYHSCFMFVRPQFWVWHMGCCIDWDVSWVYSVLLNKCCDRVFKQAVGFLLFMLGREYSKKTGKNVEKGHVSPLFDLSLRVI